VDVKIVDPAISVDLNPSKCSSDLSTNSSENDK